MHVKNKFLLGIIIILSTIRILSILLSQGIIFDELLYSSSSRGLAEGLEYGQLWEPLAGAYIPPAYSLSLYPVFLLFGSSILVAKLFSVLLGLISIVLIYYLGKEIYNKRVGLYASLIMASAPLHWFYSTKIMTEPLIAIFSILFFLFLFRAEKNQRYLIPTIMALTLLFLTKYATGLISIFFILFVLIWRRNYLVKKEFWMGIIISLLILTPWLLFNVQAFGSPIGAVTYQFAGSDGFGSNFSPFYFFAIPVQMGIFSIFMLIGLFHMWKTKDTNLLPFILLFVVVFAGLSALEVKRFRLLMMIVPIFVIITSLSLIHLKEKFKGKYMFFAMVGLAVLLNVGLTVYSFGSHDKLERYVSLEAGGLYLQQHCNDMDIFTNVHPYAWWYTHTQSGGLEDIGDNGCVLIDNFNEKHDDLESSLREKGFEEVWGEGTAKVFVL